MEHHTTATVAPASRSFVQQATVTAELPSGASTSRVDSLIVSASLTMARYLRREPWFATWSTRRNGPGGHYLKLPRWPIQSVTSVTEGTGDSPSTVTASTYEIAGNTRRDRLYREDGWTFNYEAGWRPYASSGGAALIYTAAYPAGWVMPDQVTEWAASQSVAASSWWAATNADEPFIFQADATGGTTGGTEPTWPTASGGTVTDNGITFTAYDQRLPQELEEIALSLVLDWFDGGLQVPSGIKSESVAGGARLEYRDFAPPIPQSVSLTLAAYR